MLRFKLCSDNSIEQLWPSNSVADHIIWRDDVTAGSTPGHREDVSCDKMHRAKPAVMSSPDWMLVISHTVCRMEFFY